MNKYNGHPRPSSSQTQRQIGERHIIEQLPAFRRPSASVSSTPAEVYALDIVRSRPRYISPPETPPTLNEGEFQVWLKYGGINNVIPSNIFEPISITQDTTIFLQVNFSQNTDQVEIASVDVLSQPASSDFPVNPPFPRTSVSSQGLPTHVFIRLGEVFQDSGLVEHIGRGSISIESHLATAFTNNTESQFAVGLTIRRAIQ